MAVDRNLSLELARVTEAAAIAASHFMGRNDKNAADHEAVEAMRGELANLDIDGTVIIGEGEKDEAPMLYHGEKVGRQEEDSFPADIAVDPIDGTRLLAFGMPNSIAVIAIAEAGSMYPSHGVMYMDKLAVGAEARDVININKPITWNLKQIAKAKGMPIANLTVCLLDRERNQPMIQEVKQAGARIKLITDGDVAAAIMAGLPGTGIDVLVGIGGSPEAVIAAAALKCLGGAMQCKLWPRSEAEKKEAIKRGSNFDKVFAADDLVTSDEIFVSLTGITGGEIVSGVKYYADYVSTETIVLRSRSGTIRRISARHHLDKKKRLA